MDSNAKNFISVVIIVAILSFIGGVAGELWVNSFLLPSPYLSFKNYNDLSARIDELIKGRESVKISNVEDAAAEKISQIARLAIVSIYRQKKFFPNSGQSLMDAEFLGAGAVITNDGWVATASDAAYAEKSAFFIVSADHQIFETTEVKIYKKIGVTFLRARMNNSPVVEFVSRKNLIEGQKAFVFGQAGAVFATNIKDNDFSEKKIANDFIHTSEDFYQFVLLNDRLPDDFVGGPVVTAQGKMLGILKTAAGEVTPISHFAGLMKTLDLAEELTRPYLGVIFYDLSEILNPLISEKQGVKIKSIKADSPALSILLPDDIILNVEADKLNAEKNLPEIIAEYQPGSSIKLLLLRKGEEKQVEVKLAKKAQ
ncbi:serine protease [Candidatus Falkowbacteria bacterium]|nr:serine protease [Candidatus Falkowbacteria bacterium]